MRPDTPRARRGRPRAAWCAGALLAGAALVAPALASDTQWWTSNQAADFARGEARGVIVEPNGTLRLGPRTSTWAAESLGVLWAMVPLADGSIALGGDGGRVDRWTSAGGVKRWIKLPVGQVLCLARDGDGLLAGTAPGGAIYRVSARGDTSLLARTGERYVWGLAAGARGIWYAATGTRGRLMRIENGVAKIVLDTDESNLVSILSDGKGGVYCGGDSRGRVMHVSAAGVARTLFDAPEDEVRALALGADGALYAATTSVTAVAPVGGALTIGAGGPGASAEPDDDTERPTAPTPAAPSGHAVVYRIVPDSSTVTWWTAIQPVAFALIPQGRDLVAATGNRAGVYRLSDANQASALFIAPQGQITALATVGDQIFAGASNPAAIWRLGPGAAERGELLSPAFDAHRTARFGHLVWHGSGARPVFETRSGNTDPPDTTWTPWEGGETAEDGARITAPPGRYLQWKVALTKADQRVSAVETSWRTLNQAPRLENLVVAPQGAAFREGELQPRTEPVTQVLPGGQKVEYSTSSANTPRALRALPAWARGLRTVQWRGTDPDGDALRYRVDERAEGATDWIKIVDDLESPAFTWDTNALPDGRYRLRVTATDAPSNAVGEERTATLESPPFSIDNTAPRIPTLTAAPERGAVRIEGEATDESGRLAELDVATDEGDWRPLTPDGGLTDTPRAAFHARLGNLTPGEHTVSVRAVDLAGNVTTRAVRVTVPRER